MRIVRIALILLAVLLLIGAGTTNPTGNKGAGNRAEPTCPPFCPS